MKIPTGEIALIDMDGVLADFDGAFHEQVRTTYPEITMLDPLPEPPDFYAAKYYPEQHYQTLRAISNSEHFFASLPVMPGAIEGWQRVIDEGFRPQICSSPIGSNPYSKQEKLGWLEEHFAPVFGSWVVETAIITSDKHLSGGALLIDDRPNIRHAESAPWNHVIFDQPCNRHIETNLRLQNWFDPNLGSILRTAARR